MAKLSILEAEHVLGRIIDTNKQLQDNGQVPVSIGFTGPAGIGKTAIVQQIAEKRGMSFVKISLHEFEEVGDLIGYPITEYRIVRKADGKEAWVSEKMLDSVNNEKWRKTTETHMTYAKPAWVPTEFNENGTIVLLDDYARSSSMLIQATMELINTGRYTTWELPRYTTIVLTANPDDGTYNVQSMDIAQKTRYVEFKLDFEIDPWARWAESAGIDSRAINFAMSYGDELFRERNGVTIANPRSYVTFCKAISGVKNWKDDLEFILMISKGCFNDKDNAVGRIFTVFINNGYDKLISPRDIFTKDWKQTVNPKLTEALYGKGNEPDVNNYNPAIASMLATRIVNYVDVYFEKPGYVSAPVNDRLVEIFHSGLFKEDLNFYIVKSIVSKHAKQCAKLLQDSEITSKVIL